MLSIGHILNQMKRKTGESSSSPSGKKKLKSVDSNEKSEDCPSYHPKSTTRVRLFGLRLKERDENLIAIVESDFFAAPLPENGHNLVGTI